MPIVTVKSNAKNGDTFNITLPNSPGNYYVPGSLSFKVQSSSLSVGGDSAVIPASAIFSGVGMSSGSVPLKAPATPLGYSVWGYTEAVANLNAYGVSGTASGILYIIPSWESMHQWNWPNPVFGGSGYFGMASNTVGQTTNPTYGPGKSAGYSCSLNVQTYSIVGPGYLGLEGLAFSLNVSAAFYSKVLNPVISCGGVAFAGSGTAQDGLSSITCAAVNRFEAGTYACTLTNDVLEDYVNVIATYSTSTTPPAPPPSNQAIKIATTLGSNNWTDVIECRAWDGMAWVVIGVKHWNDTTWEDIS